MACFLLIICSPLIRLVERHNFGFVAAKTLVNLESNLYKHLYPWNESKCLHSKNLPLVTVFRVALVSKLLLMHLDDSLVGWLICALCLCLSQFERLPGSHLLEKELDGSTLPERNGPE